MNPARAGRGQGAQLRQRARAAFLGEPDQVHEHLGRGLGVGERAVTGLRRNAEEVRERGQPHAAEPSLEEAARERGRAERRLGQAWSPSCCSRKRWSNRALCATSRSSPANARNRRSTLEIDGRASELLLAQAGQPRDRLGERDPRIDERLERADELEPPHAHRADLADLVAPGREPGRLEVEDDERGFFEQRVGEAARGGRPSFPCRRRRLSPAVTSSSSDRPGRRGSRTWRRGREPPRRRTASPAPRACPRAGRVRRARAAPSDESEHTFVLQPSAQSGSSGIVSPWSRPSSTARVIAADPNRGRAPRRARRRARAAATRRTAARAGPTVVVEVADRRRRRA